KKWKPAVHATTKTGDIHQNRLGSSDKLHSSRDECSTVRPAGRLRAVPGIGTAIYRLSPLEFRFEVRVNRHRSNAHVSKETRSHGSSLMSHSSARRRSEMTYSCTFPGTLVCLYCASLAAQ